MFFHLFKIIFISLLFIGVSHYGCILLKNNLKSKHLEPEQEHVIINTIPLEKQEKKIEPSMDTELNDYIKELKKAE